jgi:WD40 repeat protein
MAELYCGLRGGMISLYDIHNQKIKVNLQGHSSIITSMTIYRRNEVPCALASAAADGKIKLWDLKTKGATTNFKGHFSEINTLTFSPDFTYLASGANDGVVKIWDIRMTNRSLKEISSPEQKAINCIEFNPFAVAFAYGSKDKKIRYWNLEKFNKIGESTADRLPIEYIAFDNDGKNMFCATNESLKYWEITEHNINLIDMFETGWNKLQSFHYIEGRAICGLSTFSNKISYYLIKYKDLMKAPNMRLRADPNMGNISEVQESEDSTFFENDLNLHLDVPKTPLNNKNYDTRSNKFDEYANTNQVLKDFDKNSRKPKSSKRNTTNLGISKFINNTTMSNVSMTLSDISSSKIENESIFIKNALNMIGANNYKGPIVKSTEKKPYNPDDRPLPVPKDLETKNKNNVNNKNNNDDSTIGKIVIGNISNLDISDSDISKNDMSLNTIFGKTNNFNSNLNNNVISSNDNGNNANNNNLKNNININKELNPLIESLERNKNLNDDKNDDFRELGDNDLDLFLGKSGQDKDIDEISVIQNSGLEDDNFLENNIFNMTNKSLASALKNNTEGTPSTNDLSVNNTINNPNIDKNQNLSTSIDNNSFASINSNQTLGVDFTQLLQEHGGMNETKHAIPQAEDLPILQEINSQHDNMRRAITKRYNAIKTLSRRWAESNIPSTVHELNIMKDTTVTNDFFIYAIINRDDISKIPFPLESGPTIIPHIQNLLRSKFDVYWKTACRVGIIFLKIYMERIEMTKQQYKIASPMGQTDPLLEEKMKASDEIIKLFKQIFQSKHLKAHFKPGEGDNNNVAYAFYTDLEFFLRPYDDNRIVIRPAY